MFNIPYNLEKGTTYYRERKSDYITDEPRKTNGKNVDIFIRYKCAFCQGASISTKDIYHKYIRFCNDHMLEYTTNFNAFARAFRYWLMWERLIPGIGVYSTGQYRRRQMIYTNLVVNY